MARQDPDSALVFMPRLFTCVALLCFLSAPLSAWPPGPEPIGEPVGAEIAVEAIDRTFTVFLGGAESGTPPSAPALLSPANGASVPAGSVGFSWSASSAGTPPITYEVRVTLEGSLVGSCQTTGTSCGVALVQGSYIWNVIASNQYGSATSTSRTLNVVSGGGETLTVILGGSGSGTVTSQPVGINCPGTCSASFAYGTAVTLIATAGSGSTFEYWSGDGSDCGGGYRCVTMDASRTVGATFSVAQPGIPPSAPVLQSPANGATVSAGSVGFSWIASSSGTPPITYEVRVTLESSLVGSCHTTGTSCSVTLTQGSYIWNVVASNQYGSATSISRTLTVGPGGPVGTLTITASPAVPKVGQLVTFLIQPSLNQGDSAVIQFGDGNSGNINGPCLLGVCSITHTYTSAGTKNVTATATIGGQQYSGSRQLVVEDGCAEPNPPVANFDWAPKGTLMFNGVLQAQPYVGQIVQLQDLSTNNPTSWVWLDFGDGSPASYVQNPTKVWQHSGSMTVRMRSTNCAGNSQTVTREIVIHADQRAVIADFTWSPTVAQAGIPVVFTAKTGFAYGDPTEFHWSFGDGSSSISGNTASHVFQQPGAYLVTLTAKRGIYQGVASRWVEVGGDPRTPESVVAADAAKVAGYNNSLWRTDFRIFNPAEEPTTIWLAVLPEGRDNRNPLQIGPYQLLPRATLVLNNILGVFEQAGVNYSKAAIRITFENQSNLAPVVVARTYTDSPGGGTFGQFVPGNPVVAQSTTSPLWLTGLQSDGLQEGFRTNFGIANLRGDASGAPGVKATIYDAQGVEVATKTFNLAPYGYIQHAVHNIFGDPALQTLGTYSMKIDVPAGLDVAPYASVVDNSTNDPVLIPAQPSATSPVFLAAVARNPGALGTVWRTDFQITNPDRTATRHWEVTFLPKGQLPTVSKQVSLAAGKTQRIQDAVAWIYDPLPLPAPEAQGMLRFRPLDGSGIYPVVVGRTYNVTATGTFGQNIPAMHAGTGAAKGGPVEWLVLPGMSTEDIARTNVGFVNLSADKVVDFEVYFFDESGNLLNPDGQAYTFALNFGGWDQDKLENRFRNRFGQDLPANLRAVTALIRVRHGGPGTAYASVIDSLTGDPVFIPARGVK